jgi:hypothetical protein
LPEAFLLHLHISRLSPMCEKAVNAGESGHRKQQSDVTSGSKPLYIQHVPLNERPGVFAESSIARFARDAVVRRSETAP